jgi:hypothetical protein
VVKRAVLLCLRSTCTCPALPCPTLPALVDAGSMDAQEPPRSHPQGGSPLAVMRPTPRRAAPRPAVRLGSGATAAWPRPGEGCGLRPVGLAEAFAQAPLGQLRRYLGVHEGS